MRELPEEAVLHSLTGRLPVEVLPAGEETAVAESLSDEGVRVVRLRVAAGEIPVNLTSGASFSLLARREGWLRVELRGTLDEALAELRALGLTIQGVELV